MGLKLVRAKSVARLVHAFALGAILFVFPVASRAGCILPADDALFDGQFAGDSGSSAAVEVTEPASPQPAASPLNIVFPEARLNPAHTGGSQDCAGSPSEPTSGSGSSFAAVTSTLVTPPPELSSGRLSEAEQVYRSPPPREMLDPPKMAA